MDGKAPPEEKSNRVGTATESHDEFGNRASVPTDGKTTRMQVGRTFSASEPRTMPRRPAACNECRLASSRVRQCAAWGIACKCSRRRSIRLSFASRLVRPRRRVHAQCDHADNTFIVVERGVSGCAVWEQRLLLPAR